MTALPNPFESAGEPAAMLCADSVAAPCLTDPTVAAADQFDGPDLPLADLVSRGFDPEAFISDCEPLPAFIRAPSQSYLRATDLIPVLQVLAGH